MPELITKSLLERSIDPGRTPVDVLLVDDNPVKLMALETALAPLGENIVRAFSGREALRHLLTRDFATIILDVNMPELDGFETAQMIRARARSAATPIIFVSAVNIDEADASKGYSLGAVDYICAPLSPEVLRAKVGVFVELHRKNEESRLQAMRLQERSRELERSQRDLRLSERMASIGTLCAGLGHDMGNLLLPISVWIDSVDPDRLPPDLQEGVQSLRACIQYLRKLASGLRLVSLDPAQSAGEEKTALPAWAHEVGPILRNAVPRGVTLEIDVPDDCPAALIAAHRLAQIAFNLVQNSGEALRDRTGGMVRLWAMHDRAAAGVRVGVTDNGPGMSPDVLARCLDPFFTTKSRGISTGLGLSLVQGILQSAGATLEISSSPEEGATFSFLLPCAEPRATIVPDVLIEVADPRIRSLASSLARASGCRVVGELGDDHPRPAVWITDNSDALDKANERFAGRSDRLACLLTNGSEAGRLTAATPLTGSNGLGARLRRFVHQLAAESARREASSDPDVGAV